MWFETPGHLEVVDDRLKIAGKDVQTLAEEFGTPLYVCNVSRVVANYRRVETVFAQWAGDTPTKVYYAMKANGAGDIIKRLNDINAHIEVASVGELKFLLENNVDPKRIFFTGIGFGLDNVKFIAECGATINIDSFSQLELFRPFAPLAISIRFNPGITTGYNEKLEMSGNRLGAGKLGIHRDRIIEAFELAESYGLKPTGLHQHIGSNYFGNNLYNFFEATKTTLDVALQLSQKGFNIASLNLGGGIGVRNAERMTEFPLELYCKGIWDKIRQSGLNFKMVSIEPGRYIVADSCILLSSVNMVEEKAGINYIGLDSGFNLYNHRFLYGIEPEIFNVSRIAEEKISSYCVSGYLGESGDVFSDDKTLPLTVVGDVLGIFPAGAYCASEIAAFHMQQVPKQLYLEEEKDGFDIFPFCKACPRNCCYIGAVNVLPHEYDRIVDRTGRDDVFARHNEYYIIDKKKGDPCPFLGKDGVTCTVQDIKPADCKVWPLYFDEKGDPDHNTISPLCPAHKFMPDDYIGVLRNSLHEIPESLRLEYYEDTFDFGYELKPLKKP